MKPIVIYVGTNKDGKLEMTKEQFEQFIQESFDQGYKAGMAKGIVVYPSITNPTPSTPLTCQSDGNTVNVCIK